MRKIKWSRMICTAIAISMLTGILAGCQKKPEEQVTINPMEAKQSNAISFDFIGGKDVMPIGGYYGPYLSRDGEAAQTPPDYNSEEFWQMIAECGLNLVSYSRMNYGDYPDQVVDALKKAEKYKIASVVYDYRLIQMALDNNTTLADVTERVSNYMHYPAFAGVYLVDEPGTSFFGASSNKERRVETYESIAAMLNQEIGLFTYTNAHPSGTDETLFKNYERYIREFCRVLQPRYLSFDRYPFDRQQEGYMDRYFYDLSVVRKVAKENNLPFWTYIQAGSQWTDTSGKERFDSDGYYPNEGEFDWNVNVALAFGTQGINYFPIIQPYYFAYAESTPFDFERNGLIGAWGNKNRWYYYAQDMNKHIRAIDEVLMNSVNEGVLVSGEQATKDMKLAKDNNVLLEGTSWRELKSVTGDAMIGCFNYQGRTALYVVNYSTEYAQKVDLTFHDSYDWTMVQQAETKKFTGSDVRLDMLPGEGILLVF